MKFSWMNEIDFSQLNIDPKLIGTFEMESTLDYEPRDHKNDFSTWQCEVSASSIEVKYIVCQIKGAKIRDFVFF